MTRGSQLQLHPQFLELVEAVRARSTGLASHLHGEHHWQCVALVGRELAAAVPGADAKLVRLFALFHDSMRENDGYDPHHGRRASGLARELLTMSDERLLLLTSACDEHADGLTTHDPTIGACWDADRLNLWRVGKEPDPALLSTAAAREPERIQRARALQRRELTWAAVL